MAVQVEMEHTVVIAPSEPPPPQEIADGQQQIDAENRPVKVARVYKIVIVSLTVMGLAYDLFPITAQIYLTVAMCKRLFVGLGLFYAVNVALCAYVQYPTANRRRSEVQFYLTTMKGVWTIAAIDLVCGIIMMWVSTEFPNSTLDILDSGNMTSIKESPDAMVAYTTYHSIFMWHMCGSIVAIAIMMLAKLPTPIPSQRRRSFAVAPTIVSIAAAAA